MTPPSVEEVKQTRQALVGKPIKDHGRLLRDIGNYFLRCLPSDIDNDYVLETEALLNTLYLTAVNDDDVSENIQDAILEALGLVAELSDVIKQKVGETRNSSFFKSAKRLGQILINISG